MARSLDAACDCGVGYLPVKASVAAAKAIEKNPEASNRAIAKEIGVAEGTVRNARADQLRKDCAVEEKRTGLDGKTRKMPTTKRRAGNDTQLRPEEQMPTEEEADESWQEDVYDHASLLVERMAEATRRKFIAYLNETSSSHEQTDEVVEDEVISLIDDSAEDIALELIILEDQAKVRKIAKYLNDHLKHPERTTMERMVAIGRVKMDGLNGPLSKTAALAELREPKGPQQDHSWLVEATTADGRHWRNGVRLGSREEAEAYIEWHVRFDLEQEGYASAEIMRCDDLPTNEITRKRKGGRTYLLFEDGTCGSLHWHPITDPAV